MSITNPFSAGVANSRLFRIPALFTLKSGRILACGDVRYGNGTDDPANIETAVRYSDDNGKTWSPVKFVNSFNDMEHADHNVAIPKSASFCDSAICEAEDNVVYHVCDACPAFMGLWRAGTYGKGSGYIDGKLSLCDFTSAEKAESTTLDKNHYPYYVGEFDEQGFAPVLRHSDSSTYENYFVDREYYIYQKSDDSLTPVTVKQMNKDGSLNDNNVHANIFFAYAPIKIYPTYYLWVKKSLDGGETWESGKIINTQVGSSGFTGFSPGRGIAVEKDGKTRVIFAIYDNNDRTEYTSTIYTDDGGETWQRSPKANKVNGAGKSSESQLVLMNNNVLRMYSRNTAKYISYCDSTDFGESWGEYEMDTALEYCSNCMVSFINTSMEINGKKVIAAALPARKKRKSGKILLGVYGENNYVTWLYRKVVTNSLRPFDYVYSCLTEDKNGNILDLYESDKAEFTLKAFTPEELKVKDKETLSFFESIKSIYLNIKIK
ncbi:MAG: exo-alpha-sialidase [Clostridia bacterium]|nr:exo-alpha-sialidase [Clostridia bacterium]